MNKPRIIGLTGPTGSGKSTVAQIFLDSGYALIDADELSRLAVAKQSDTLKKLTWAFSEDILNADGTLDRRALAKLAFCDKEKTKLLNSIVHPAVEALLKKRIDELAGQNCDRIIYDAPLLFESEGEKLCDKVISVLCPKEIRIKRIMERDGLSFEDAITRISAQPDDKFYFDRSDIVVVNDSTVSQLEEKAKRLTQEV